MTPAEKRKARLEAQIAQTRAEVTQTPEYLAQRAKKEKHAAKVFTNYNEDPAGAGITHSELVVERTMSTSRNPDGARGIEEGQSRRKELTFNTYLSQLEEPRSFINLLPPALKDAAMMLPEELVGVDEDALIQILHNKYGYSPTSAAEAMRMNFWIEHDRVAATRTEVMTQANIYLGVVDRAYFHKIVTEKSHILAYIMCRPPEYEAVMRGLLNLSTRRIRDVLNIPLQKPTGELQDPKVIELVLKAAAMVDLRAKGGYVQRSETKNLTLMKQENSYTNVFQAASSQKTFDITKIADNIDEKIALLEKEMAAVTGQLVAPEPTTEKGDITHKLNEGIDSNKVHIDSNEVEDAEFKEQF